MTEETQRPRGAGRAWAWLVTLVVAGAVLLPVKEHFERRLDDSFPLSSYPMFANPRPAWEQIVYVVGTTAEDERVVLPYRLWATGGMHQGRAQIQRGTRTARDRLEMCRLIADNVAKSRRERYRDVKEVRIVRGFFERDVYFGERKREAKRERLLQRCDVERAP